MQGSVWQTTDYSYVFDLSILDLDGNILDTIKVFQKDLSAGDYTIFIESTEIHIQLVWNYKIINGNLKKTSSTFLSRLNIHHLNNWHISSTFPLETKTDRTNTPGLSDAWSLT